MIIFTKHQAKREGDLSGPHSAHSAGGKEESVSLLLGLDTWSYLHLPLHRKMSERQRNGKHVKQFKDEDKFIICSRISRAGLGQSEPVCWLVLTFCRRCLECRLSARTADAAATTYRQIRICLLSLSLCVCVCVQVLMFAAVEMGLRFCRRICDKSLCTSESIKKRRERREGV